MDGLRTGSLTPLLEAFNSFVSTLNTPEALKFITGEIDGMKKGLADTASEFQKIAKLIEGLKGGKFVIMGNTERELDTILRLFR